MSNFGFFDDERKEYVITDPATPAPWANYLGSPEYGAIISNNAGGYSFARSGANGRILRYIFNDLDRPGRYMYIRDDESADFWSASWQPVGKPLSQYRCECRHGMAYTKMKAEYDHILSESIYYVPLGAEYEVWFLKLTNTDNRPRRLTVTGYAEFTSNNNYEQDQVNLQYSQFITRTEYSNNMIRQLINGNLDIIEASCTVDDKNVTERFFGLAGAEIDSFCGSRDDFLGAYHDYRDPAAVAGGRLPNTLNYNGNSCGALSTKLELPSGQSRYMAFVLGMKRSNEAAGILKRYNADPELCLSEVEELRSFWHARFEGFKVKTPDRNFNTMVNTWNAYNCFMTFTWSRAASFTYCGLRNGYGYRDTVQDIQGIIHLKPEMAAGKLRFMLSAQVDNGAGLPLVKFTHNAGHEDTPDDESYVKETGHPAYRADDALWLFPTVYKYIAESGNIAFLDEEILYANRDSGTVYDHLKRAIDFSMNHLGDHGMPAGLYADWNDCLRLGKKGESSFVAMQFYYALMLMLEFAEAKKDEEYIAFLKEEAEKTEEIINNCCWNEDRFIRGYTEDGRRMGDRDAEEANLWLNPQSWSVISRLASKEQAEKALEKVHEQLNTEYGAVLMDPPFHKEAFPGALAVIYNPGVKENAGIFSQSQGWIVLAEALLGHGGRAYEYYRENSPAEQNFRAEIRKLEPYCYGQFTEGKASPNLGRSHVHWLTGTASTMMVGCVEGILGMRPDLYGLKIDPAIPAEWSELEIEKEFRGHKLHIRIDNPKHVESGASECTLNGEIADGNYFAESMLLDENEIRIILG